MSCWPARESFLAGGEVLTHRASEEGSPGVPGRCIPTPRCAHSQKGSSQTFRARMSLKSYIEFPHDTKSLIHLMGKPRFTKIVFGETDTPCMLHTGQHCGPGSLAHLGGWGWACQGLRTHISHPPPILELLPYPLATL